MISRSWKLVYDTWNSFNEDRAPRLGAALSFFTVLSLAPTLIIVIAIAGLFYDKASARGEILAQLTQNMGKQAADVVAGMLDSANNRRGSGPWALVFGLVTALFGAAGVFGQLQDALDTVWGVKLRSDLPFLQVIRNRFVSFGMVFGIGFMLLVSLVASAAVAAITRHVPGPGWLAEVGNAVVSFAVATGLFALIFKILPDAQVQWRDVWVGALLTSALFTIGKFALGWYLGRGAATSIYGPAASLVLILLWVYYAAQILFFGAEFTKIYANAYGSRIKPDAHAVAVTDEARARQGLEPAPAVRGAQHDPKPGEAPGDKRDAATPVGESAPPSETVPSHEAARHTPGKLDDVAMVTAGLGLAWLLHLWRERRKATKE